MPWQGIVKSGEPWDAQRDGVLTISLGSEPACGFCYDVKIVR